jgi:hypothetical protein
MENYQLECVDWLKEGIGEAYDDSFTPLFLAAIYGYEEWSWVCILEKNENLYEIGGGYSVMSDNNDFTWEPGWINQEIAMEILETWLDADICS